MKLFQLADGSWIDQSYILMVEVADRERFSDSGVTHAPRVIIHLQGDRRVIDCESLNDAEVMRDQIASVVNAGRIVTSV